LLLPSGKVLVAGGRETAELQSVEVYDPVSDRWTPLPDTLDKHDDGIFQLLPSGAVLAAVGLSSKGKAHAGAEWLSLPITDVPYMRPTLTSLPSSASPGQILNASGTGFTGLFDISAGSTYNGVPANFPLLFFDCGSESFFCPTFDWDDTHTSCRIPSDAPKGDCQVSVIVNGIHSASRVKVTISS
jgi:hypothetical protein